MSLRCLHLKIIPANINYSSMHCYPDFMFLLAHWVHSIDPVAIHFPQGFFLNGIYWYGVAYVLGFLVAGYMLHLYYKKGMSPLNSDQQSGLMVALILGVLVGGRLGYMLLYQREAFFEDPMLVFRVWERGMASHGAFVGIAIALILFAKTHKQPVWLISDIAVTLAPAGIMLGRIANFINGELWGKISNVSWAVVFPQSAAFSQMPILLIPPRHPSQLYEALLEGLLLGIYIVYRFWKKHAAKSIPDGQITGEFLIAYGCLRILGEFFREPDAPLIAGLQAGQFYSVVVILFGIGFIFWSRLKARA